MFWHWKNNLFKKSDYKVNGSYEIMVSTLNGCFPYVVKRLKIGASSGNFFSSTDYFDSLSDKKNSYQSQGLRTFATKYATKMSYANVYELIGETCKGTTLSAQHIHTLVQAAARRIASEQKAKIAIFEASKVVLEAVKADIYAVNSEEVVYLSDDICVKRQKTKRDKQPIKKKINQTMTMIVPKIEREVHCQNMLQLLWNGKSVETIAYLSKVRAKNIKAQEMLTTCLRKNEHNIIDCERRKLAGKTIRVVNLL